MYVSVLQTWIQEKKSVLATVQEIETKDLSSVITVQRRLNVIQRDLGALEDKVSVDLFCFPSFSLACTLFSQLKISFLFITGRWVEERGRGTFRKTSRGNE